jgi:hypothetical protein
MTTTMWLAGLGPAVAVFLFFAQVRRNDHDKLDMELKTMRDALAALRLYGSDNYVSHVDLTSAMLSIERAMRDGFARLDEKIDLLFDRTPPRRRPTSEAQ